MSVETWTILAPVLTILTAGVSGLTWKLAKHLGCGQKHPEKKDVVFQDVCNERYKHLCETLNSHKTDADIRHKELKQDMHREFAEVKNLIRAN